MHKIVKTFTTGGFAQGRHEIGREVVVVCACGWKEKAPTEREAQERFARHKVYPHIPTYPTRRP